MRRKASPEKLRGNISISPDDARGEGWNQRNLYRCACATVWLRSAYSPTGGFTGCERNDPYPNHARTPVARLCLPLSAQVAADAVEGRADLATECCHRADCSNSDESGDQAIFNGGSTLIVPDEFD